MKPTAVRNCLHNFEAVTVGLPVAYPSEAAILVSANGHQSPVGDKLSHPVRREFGTNSLSFSGFGL